MGWYYTHDATRADIVRDLRRPYTCENKRTGYAAFTVETLHSCLRGNVLYSLRERRYHDANEPPERWIAVDLLQRSRDGWGYKPMDESMHPYYYACPLGYLDKAESIGDGGLPTNQAAARWREKVREYHAR